MSDGGTSSEEYSDDYAEGMIIRQSTDAGTKVAEGTSVSYVVSKGPKPADQVKVPTLTGKTLGDAISALNARNLTYTEVDIDIGRCRNCDHTVCKQWLTGKQWIRQ